MPLIHNKHQPFFPDPDSPNNLVCGSEQYCHPFQPGDSFSTQFYQTPCNNNQVEDPEFDDFTLGSELITNGDFATDPSLNWSLGVGVTWDNVNFNINCVNVSGNELAQAGLSLTANNTYQISFTLTRTSGEVTIILGASDPLQTLSQTFSTSGTFTFTQTFYATGFENITFYFDNFNGTIDNVSIKEQTLTLWQPNGAWLFDDGFACHIDGQTGDLKDTNANYIDAGGYYVGGVTLSGYVQGYVEMWFSDVLAGTMSANGTFTFYDYPTANGTIKFVPSSDFIGCLSYPSCYKLRNDYSGAIIDSDGNEFDVSNYFSYYNEFVTLEFDFSTVGNYELPTGCYSVKVYDQCLLESDNLITNGDFALGFTDWNKNNNGTQYEIVADQLKLKFYPFSQGATDYVVNGDFSSGSAWTLNAGWTILGGKAVHTPGNTGTLFQTLTLPTPPPPTLGYNYLIKFTVTNWTAGTINCKLSNGLATTSNQRTFAGNDTFIQAYSPAAGGNVLLTFTPSNDFDGEIDDVACIFIVHIPFPLLYHNNVPLITAGTYQTEWEIVSSSDPSISARGYLNGASPNPPYESSVGVYSYQQSYTLNGGVYYIYGNFTKTSGLYSVPNFVEGEITIDNVSLVKVEPFEATYQTECLSYNENGWGKTKMLVGWCDQNAFGFEFVNTGYKLRQRALVRSISPIYQKEKNIQKMGSGNARVVYSEVEKYWELHTDFASETFHDCMSIQIDCDHFGIGDTQGDLKEYIAEPETYQPNWNGDGAYSLATAVINLRVKDKGQIFNRHL